MSCSSGVNPARTVCIYLHISTDYILISAQNWLWGWKQMTQKDNDSPLDDKNPTGNVKQSARCFSLPVLEHELIPKHCCEHHTPRKV